MGPGARRRGRRRRPAQRLDVDPGLGRPSAARRPRRACPPDLRVTSARDGGSRRRAAARTPRRTRRRRAGPAPGQTRTPPGRSSTAACRAHRRGSVSAAAKRAARSALDRQPGVMQPATERADQPRQVKLDRLDAERRGINRPACPVPSARTTLLVLAILEDRAQRPRIAAGSSSSLTPSSASAASQSIASAIPGGFCTSESRIRQTASATCTASVSAGARDAPADDFDLPLRARGSRSTDTGSGA